MYIHTQVSNICFKRLQHKHIHSSLYDCLKILSVGNCIHLKKQSNVGGKASALLLCWNVPWVRATLKGLPYN
ncbi:MAG: hypothetical protein DWB56_10535 [Candidatus Jettenia sp.]|uniref:Uncharacterized protein n=1 Tax=Candidatus Jettenia caeni TaxID=247490 RepID=I3IGD4_9BACT|nr:hypothetical protein [Candidatus Jettenia sp.]GAB60779.1 hypothetical protein KSU1_A0012 [Candidatus Jettenia caeni]